MKRSLLAVLVMLTSPFALAQDGDGIQCCAKDDSAKMNSSTTATLFVVQYAGSSCPAGTTDVTDLYCCVDQYGEPCESAIVRPAAACDLINNPGKYHHESPNGTCTNGATGNLQSIKAQFSVCPAVNGKDKFDEAVSIEWNYDRQECLDDNEVGGAGFNVDCTDSWLESNVCSLMSFQY